MQIDLLVQRNEIGLVVGDEDRLFLNHDSVKDVIGDPEQIAVPIAGRPISATVGLLHQGRREALVDPEFHAPVARPADRAPRPLTGRPRRGLPLVQSTATAYASAGMWG